MPKRDHIFNLHAKQGPQAVAGKVGEQVPVISQVGDDNAGREQPDTGLNYPDPAGKICMTTVDVDCPYGLKTGLNNPCDQDNNG
jgi:hypothetical protein